ncbi:hypothetical protein D3C72_1059730 [compost metagenome]
MPARSKALRAKSTPAPVRADTAGNTVLPATMPSAMASVSALRPRCSIGGHSASSAAAAASSADSNTPGPQRRTKKKPGKEAAREDMDPTLGIDTT